MPAQAQRMSSLLAADKEFLPCQGGHIRGAGGEAWARTAGGCGWWWRKWHMYRGWARLKSVGGHRARAERTANMPSIVVTLDVSKLSGWLKADAPCGVEEKRTLRDTRSSPGGTPGRRDRAWGGGMHGDGRNEGWAGGHRARVKRT